MTAAIHMLLEGVGCRIVFVSDYNTADALKKAIQTSHPQYIGGMGKYFRIFRKVGPFKIKNKASLFNILKKTKILKPQFERDKARATKALMNELEEMDLHACSDRRPTALSYLQRLRASMLCDMLDEHYAFILNDHDTETPADPEKRIASKSAYRTIAHYARTSGNFLFDDCNLLWITKLTPKEMLTLLGNEEYGASFYRFYTMKDGEITALDKEQMIREFEAEKPIAHAPATAPASAPKAPPKVTATKPKSATPAPKSESKPTAASPYYTPEKPFVKPADNEPTRIQILSFTDQDEYYTRVCAMIQSGTVKYGSCFRSLRTGITYCAMYPIEHITFLLIKNMIDDADGSLSTIDTDDLKEVGYNVDLLRNYTEDDEHNLSLEERLLRTISANEYGPTTCVGIRFVAYDGTECNEHTVRKNRCNFAEGEILEKIN